MRTPFLLTSLLFASIAAAQVDIQRMIQERAAKQQGQEQAGDATGDVLVEDDNDPFVPNNFIGSFRMEMHMFEKGVEQKNSPMNMHYWSVEDKTMMRNAMAERKGQEMRILTDLKGKWTYTLMTDEEGKKTAMKSRKKKVTMKEEAVDKEQRITVTNETKVIDGHACTKVIVTSEDGTWTGWVSKEVKAPFEDMARNARQKGNDRMMRNYKGVDGMPFEYEWVDANGKDKIVTYVRDLRTGNVDPSVFSLDGYEVVEMPSFGK